MKQVQLIEENANWRNRKNRKRIQIMLPKVRLVFDRKKVSAKSEGDVEVYVYYNAKKRYLSTGVRVRRREYRDGVVSGRADAVEMNKRLQWCVRHVQEQVNEMVENDCINLSALSFEMADRSADFWGWAESQIEQRDVTIATKYNLRSKVRTLRSYGIINTFADITLANLTKMDIRLRGMTASSRRTYHFTLKSLIHEAIRESKIAMNPYDQFTLPRENRVKTIKYLTDEELEKVKNAKVGSRMEFTRDIFLLGCYTGLRHSDIRQISKQNHYKSGGKDWIRGEQQKTGNLYNIMLLPECVSILDKYEWNMNRVHIVTVDHNLKRLACVAGLGKNLTMHMSRHTFATRALSKGVRIEVVSKMLGHTDIKMTQVYAKVLQQDVAKGFEMLME